MLGQIGSTPRWRWVGYGKHPVASDFFRLGEDFSLGKGFSDWVGKGYSVLSSKGEMSRGLCSWRFWTHGPQKETLVCGLLRDSSDRVGRPYPLLIMGIGPLRGWEEEWDLLPFACEPTWNQIEYLSTVVVNDFKKLEIEINQIRAPQPDWPEFTLQREDLGKSISGGVDYPSQDQNALEKQAQDLSGQAESFISLDQRPSHDLFREISLCHSLLKTHSRTIPNTIFMGGTGKRAYIAVFRRPLLPADFVRLWTTEDK